MEKDFENVRSLINDNLEVQSQKYDQKEEDQFIQMIAERVAELMESNMELFFNHLYRMDIDERMVRLALSPENESDESVYVTIARIIYLRQKERLESKKKYKQENIDFWAEE